MSKLLLFLHIQTGDIILINVEFDSLLQHVTVYNERMR